MGTLPPIEGTVSFLMTCLRKSFSEVVMPRNETRSTCGLSDIWAGLETDKKRSSIEPPSFLLSLLSLKSRPVGFTGSSSQSSICFGCIFDSGLRGRLAIPSNIKSLGCVFSSSSKGRPWRRFNLWECKHKVKIGALSNNATKMIDIEHEVFMSRLNEGNVLSLSLFCFYSQVLFTTCSL